MLWDLMVMRFVDTLDLNKYISARQWFISQGWEYNTACHDAFVGVRDSSWWAFVKEMKDKFEKKKNDNDLLYFSYEVQHTVVNRLEKLAKEQGGDK